MARTVGSHGSCGSGSATPPPHPQWSSFSTAARLQDPRLPTLLWMRIVLVWWLLKRPVQEAVPEMASIVSSSYGWACFDLIKKKTIMYRVHLSCDILSRNKYQNSTNSTPNMPNLDPFKAIFPHIPRSIRRLCLQQRLPHGGLIKAMLRWKAISHLPL